MTNEKSDKFCDKNCFIQCNGHGALFEPKMVKSPCNWVIFPLTQPQVANQQQQKKEVCTNPTLDSSIGSASAWYSEGPRFESWHGRELNSD